MNHIYKRAIKRYGEKNQLRKLQEESAELIVAIAHYLERGDKENLYEEMADVEIMLDQMRLIFDSGKIDDYKELKINRLKANLR